MAAQIGTDFNRASAASPASNMLMLMTLATGFVMAMIGILVHQFGWRSVFLINVPIGLLGIVLAQVLIAPTPKHARALSLLSHAIGVLILSALSFLLIEGPSLGWFSAQSLAAAATTVLATAALV